ncbi:MAG: lysophospholipase [Acetobacteraceae bacterium]|nr:lysophospholipase [Acetobacteraceae bacterium]
MLPGLLLALLVALLPVAAFGQNWVTAWAGSVQGPYPVGNPSAQPVLSFAFPSAQTGARDQSFRLIIRPDIWAKQARLRFSNAFGTRNITLDSVYAGLQMSGAAILPGTNVPVTFNGQRSVALSPGQSIWSDPVTLGFVQPGAMQGRKLAVSFHALGETGPMTWHAKALTTSYLSPPGAGANAAQAEIELGFPFSTTSWYFLDAIDMDAPPGTQAVVALGDSITDGTASTLNGDDRWPDVLSRRLHAAYGERFSVVNAGIGGNQVVGPAEYAPEHPFPGGASALQRLDRDVLSLSGVKTVIWLEGINDFSKNGNATAEAVEAGMKEGVARIRGRIPGARVVGATLTSALGSTNPGHGSPEQDAKRQALNEFIRGGALFDSVADFDKVTIDPKTGGLRPEFVPESTTGGPGDKLHPNRAGYQAMGASIPLAIITGEPAQQTPR